MEDPSSPLTSGEGQGEGAGSSPEPSTHNPEPVPATSTQHSALPDGEAEGKAPNPQPPTPDPQAEQLRTELEGVRSRWLESHRRALLAENAGRVVPELVAGSTVEEMDRSLEVARGAFEAARAAALAEIAATRIPAGNPVRQGPNLESMSPLEKIAHGLRRE